MQKERWPLLAHAAHASVRDEVSLCAMVGFRPLTGACGALALYDRMQRAAKAQGINMEGDTLAALKEPLDNHKRDDVDAF